MSTDTKAIIGTIVGTGLVVAGLLSAQIASGAASLNTRINDVRGDMTSRLGRIDTRLDRIDTRLDGIDERLRNVEVAFGKVDQRLLTIERVVLPAPDTGE